MKFTPAQRDIMEQAMEIYRSGLRQPEAVLTSPEATSRYLMLKTAGLEHEVFGCLWLDSQHQLVEDTIEFKGTIDGASVYPREIVKAGLSRNAAGVIFYHNHPSGTPEPSTADRSLTRRLKDALALIDIRVLDHIVVGADKTVSLAERGWL